MNFTDQLSFTRIGLGWLITRQDAVSGTVSNFICQGDLLRVRALFTDRNIVRV